MSLNYCLRVAVGITNHAGVGNISCEMPLWEMRDAVDAVVGECKMPLGSVVWTG